MNRLRTFGSIALERDGLPLAGRATQRRRLALLALLASAGSRGVRRDKLLAYLWPESDAEQGRHSLSQTLYSLRQELGADVILAGVDDVRLNAALLPSDLGEFEEALGAKQLGRAVALYTGPFLDGFFLSGAVDFERWLEAERERLVVACRAAHESLAQTAAAAGDHAAAAIHWRRRAELEPLNSSIALELMRALAALGDRAGAVRHARAHSALVRSELDVDVPPAIRDLADQLRVDPPALAPAPVATPPAPPERTTTRAVSDKHLRRSAALDYPIRLLRRSGQLRVEHPRMSRVGAALLVVALIVGLLVVTHRSARLISAAPRAGPLRVLVGDVLGRDSVLSGAVHEAMRAELESTAGIRVVGDAAVRQTLRLMKLPSDTPLTANVAADAAQREGASIAVTGTIRPLGRGTQIVVEMLDPRSGASLASFVARAAGDDDILPAITRLASQVRERVLGVSVDSASPMPRVTTASLPALRSYVLARDALAHGDRQTAIEFGEAALIHDSSFAMAHYLLGDVLWYEDHQRHSTMHLTKALAWSEQLPQRERLIVRARYQQLVRDRLDSALYYWQLLARMYPEEPLAYEGLWWTYRALGDPRLTAAAAESALHRDSTPTWYARYVESQTGILVFSADTANLWRFTREQRSGYPATRMARFWWAFAHDDLPAMLSAADRDAARRQTVLVAMGRLSDASRELDSIRAHSRVQYLPRALLAQARGELTVGSPVVARRLAREALAWIEHADLSAPAYARLAERTADIAARVGDRECLAGLRQLIARVDSGRALPSLRLAALALEAFSSFARGDMRSAAAKVARARDGMFFGMPTSTLLALEADARASLGEHAAADSLYALVMERPGPPDGDFEAKVIVMAAVRAQLAAPRIRTSLR